MGKHQITIVDIANKLGISKSTVSRALSNHPNVHESTRTKVLELAAEMEYEKNMFSVNLLKQASKTLGIIVPEFSRSFFPQIIITAQEEAKKYGYNMIIAQSNESYETEVENAKILLAHRVDGLLASVTRETYNFDHFKMFERKGIPIVFFNRVCEEMIVPKVIVDDFEGAFIAVEHLIKQGKRKIAHLSGPATLAVAKKRKAGYLKALDKYNIPVDENLVVHYDLSINDIKSHIDYFLNLPNKPDAIFCINDPTAIAVIQQLKQARVEIPEEIAIVGFSNDFAGSIIEPALTTVAQPIAEIGKTAAKLLIDQLQRDIKDWKAPTVVLKTNLIIRDSS